MKILQTNGHRWLKVFCIGEKDPCASQCRCASFRIGTRTPLSINYKHLVGLTCFASFHLGTILLLHFVFQGAAVIYVHIVETSIDVVPSSTNMKSLMHMIAAKGVLSDIGRARYNRL